MAAAKKSTKKPTRKPTSKKSADGTSKGFTPEERAAMRERAKELKAAASRQEGEKALLAAVAKMAKPDRQMGERLHALITTTAPELSPKTWYGMPAYAKDDKVVCFFQSADKFKTRYATLGFSDSANLDQGDMWPTAFALKELTPTVEAKIQRLVKKAVR
ncbi:MAG: iron chaperone [Actinomycetota bacterium]